MNWPKEMCINIKIRSVVYIGSIFVLDVDGKWQMTGHTIGILFSIFVFACDHAKGK